MNHVSTTAWVMIGLVWTVILANVGYCFFRLLTSKRDLGGAGE